MTTYEKISVTCYAVSAVVSAITLIVVAVAAILTFSQVRESSRARQLQSAMAIMTYNNSEELRSTRQQIVEHADAINKKLTENPQLSLSEIGTFLDGLSRGHLTLHKLRSHLSSMEQVSVLVLHDLAPDDIIEMVFHRQAKRHWLIALPFINYMRNYYGSNDYMQHFELFVQLLDECRVNNRGLTHRGCSRLKKSLLAGRKQVRRKSGELTPSAEQIASREPLAKTAT